LDIALRCPLTRSSARKIDVLRAITSRIAPLIRGADGAARRPYQRNL